MTTTDEMTLPDALRTLADLLDASPDLLKAMRYGFDRVLMPHQTAEEFRATVAALGGHRVKDADDDWYTVARQIGPITLDAYIARQKVCERVVTGVETVEVPDPDAPKVTIEREVVEWRCTDSVLRP